LPRDNHSVQWLAPENVSARAPPAINSFMFRGLLADVQQHSVAGSITSRLEPP
jgi:hypothetical protein